MSRGPKPKPPGNCESCGKVATLKRNHCHTCYVRKMRRGELEKLPSKQLPGRFTAKQEEYLTGSLLGDGALYRHKPTHKPYFAVQRQARDVAYSEWEKLLLRDFVCKWWRGVSRDHRTGRDYKWVKLRTHRCDLFVNHYNVWYGSGEKCVPENLHLSPLSLAVWFADDGYIREVIPGRLQLKLSTHGFNLDSVEFLCEQLTNRYSAYFGITLESGVKPIIYASDEAARLFIDEIDSFLPTSMDRKRSWKDVPRRKTARTANHLRKTENGKRITEIPVPEDKSSTLE